MKKLLVFLVLVLNVSIAVGANTSVVGEEETHIKGKIFRGCEPRSSGDGRNFLCGKY